MCGSKRGANRRDTSPTRNTLRHGLQHSTCPECYPQDHLVNWRELPMNETIREYARCYVGPPLIYHATLSEALAAWGQDICPEDLQNIPDDGK